MNKTMEEYIQEAPDSIRNNIERRSFLTSGLSEKIAESGCHEICMVASGSSYNAALCALEGMKAMSGMKIRIITPFYFLEYEESNTETCYLLISQSGYSTNILKALDDAERRQICWYGITGHTESDMGLYREKIYDYGLGEETVGYVTKGVVLLSLFLFLLAIQLGERKKNLSKTAEEWYWHLSLCARYSEKMFSYTKDLYEKHRKEFLSMQTDILCGGGAAWGTVCEGALKLSETLRIPCICCDPEEFLHGPYYQITPNYTIFLVGDKKSEFERMRAIANGCREVTEHVFTVGFEEKEAEFCKEEIAWQIKPLYQLVIFQENEYLASEELDSKRLHPLAKGMKKWVQAKSENYKRGR